MFIQHIDNKHVTSFTETLFPVLSVSLDISAYVWGVISSIGANPELAKSAEFVSTAIWQWLRIVPGICVLHDTNFKLLVQT